MSLASSYRVVKPVQRPPTCDTCKARHQKCSGDRPQCSNCVMRRIVCVYRSTRSQGPETSRSPETTTSLPLSRSSISDADYDRLYSEIFGDIIRRLDSSRSSASTSQEDALLDARPGNASLPSLNREVSSIVREQVGRRAGSFTFPSHAATIRKPAVEQNSDHVRQILRDLLPPEDVARHLLEMFLAHQNPVFYVCRREEARTQLALMYGQSTVVSISWFCQMFLIFAVGVQFDDIYDLDGAIYHEIGQKHMDDAIDEHPHNTIWVIRAMLLLCFYQAPTKWNSVWMYLDAAIRGAQRFQLDIGENLLKEISDDEYQEWRRLWLTVISFDRWVAILLGRLPRIKESISRDPIFKDPQFGFEDTPQRNITTLAIISGNILRDIYFSDGPSLNICHHWKTELENWLSTLTNPLQQQIKLGNIPESPKDQAEAIFNLHFMHLGLLTLVTRPFLLKAVKMRTSGVFESPIASAISYEAILCIDYASRLIKSATSIMGSSNALKMSILPVFFLINAAYIMILAAVWKLQQDRSIHGHSVKPEEIQEFALIDASIQTLEFCGQRKSFARRYLIHVKDLRRQISQFPSDDNSSGSISFVPPAVPLSSAARQADSATENTNIQDLTTSSWQNSQPTLGLPKVFNEPESYSAANPPDMNNGGWPPAQFDVLSADDQECIYDSASFFPHPNEYCAGDF